MASTQRHWINIFVYSFLCFANTLSCFLLALLWVGPGDPWYIYLVYMGFMLVTRESCCVTSKAPGQAHLRVATDKLCGPSLLISGSHSPFPTTLGMALFLGLYLWFLVRCRLTSSQGRSQDMAEMGGTILVWEKTQTDTWRLLGAGRGRETAHRVTKVCKLRRCLY